MLQFVSLERTPSNFMVIASNETFVDFPFSNMSHDGSNRTVCPQVIFAPIRPTSLDKPFAPEGVFTE